MLSCSVLLLALLASAQGRAVNISNTWVLPEEGFPVFYRYFQDRISWYEADAVCQFHHANLVTVDTTAQYDAVRAYLKELDIYSAVWVGLIRSNPDGDFTWTDYRGLSSDGYWSAAPDARAAPLCAAADPSADYRWEARACGGPTVASFICELPVPQWALGNDGCMVRALPALTILYLPESASVQLTADCGLAGVRKVQCTGNVKREGLLKDLSCVNEREATTLVSSATTDYSDTKITDATSNYTDQETTNEITIEETFTTEREESSESTVTQPTTAANKISFVKDISQTNEQKIINKLNNIYGHKNINLDLLHDNNLQRNDIPRIGLSENENFLTLEQSEKLEDERNMHHKMLHDELARHGNFETIFTQPTDHFVPPLVMAKAKISDDMTVLSLDEKHAQQLAEHTFDEHNKGYERNHYLRGENNRNTGKSTTEKPSGMEMTDKPIVMTLQPIKVNTAEKKEKVKPGLPKKYKEKYVDPKSKVLKVDNKLMKFEKSQSAALNTDETTTAYKTEYEKPNDNISIDLTVILKEPVQKVLNTKYNGDVSNRKTVQKQMPTETITENVPSTHETIKITFVNDNNNSTHTEFELTTTIVPEIKYHPTSTALFTTVQQNDQNKNKTVKNLETNITVTAEDKGMSSTTANELTTTITTKHVTLKNQNIPVTTDQTQITTGRLITTVVQNITSSTQTQNTSAATATTSASIPDTKIKTDESNNATVIYTQKLAENSTNLLEKAADFQSPLLSTANEPIHRPNRSRRPQLIQNRVNKFNLFRILG